MPRLAGSSEFARQPQSPKKVSFLASSDERFQEVLSIAQQADKCHMGIYHVSSEKRVIILLAPGFEERQVVHHTSCMRESGVPTTLVGLSSQTVSGVHGIAVHPDCSLNDLPSEAAYPLVLMSGGYQYVSSLLADPRVHQLLDNTLKQDGYVAANELAGSILPHSNAKALLNGCHFITQNNMGLDEFTHHLIGLVAD